jgi:hypothetical protein
VVFVVEKNRGRRKNTGGREEGRSSSHTLNIIDEFSNEFNP